MRIRQIRRPGLGPLLDPGENWFGQSFSADPSIDGHVRDQLSAHHGPSTKASIMRVFIIRGAGMEVRSPCFQP